MKWVHLIAGRAGRCFSAVLGFVFFWGGVLAFAAGSAAAQPIPPAGVKASDRVITSIQQFWDLSAEQKARPQAFEIQCHVTFFDAQWKNLYVQDRNGSGAYVPYGDNPHPFKAGEVIVAKGVFQPPSADVSFAQATITVVGQEWPEAVATTGRLTETQSLITKFVALEGFVDRFRRVPTLSAGGQDYLQMTLSVEGMPVVAWVQLEAGQTVEDLADATIRLEGVYNPKIGPDGRLASLELMVPSLAHLSVIHFLKDDPRFTLPIIPIETLAKLPADRRVRVSGLVKAQGQGHFVRIRDDTGQIDVATGQTRPCSINERVEAVGYPMIQGTQWQLANGLFRSVPGVTGKGAGEVPAYAGPLRLAAQVLEMSAAEAQAGREVWLTGVVTWSHPAAPFFFLQDASGGVCVMRDESTSMLRSPGRNLELRGVTGMGKFAPVVKAERFERLSDLPLPIARQVSLEHALTGVDEAQWVEMRGYLRQIRLVNDWNHLEIATAAGDFIAKVPQAVDVSEMIGALVRLHGVCTASANEQRKLTGITLWVHSAVNIQIEEPAPQNPFELPLQSLAGLGQYSGARADSRRLRVAGTVLLHSPGQHLHLQEGSDVLMVLARSKERLQPGDRVEAVGLLGRQNGRVVLREGIFRKTGAGASPVSRRLDVGENTFAKEDGQLVTLEGNVIGNARAADQLRLTVQTPRAIFEAYLEDSSASGTDELAELSNGSRLALTGIYEVQFDQFGQPESFQLGLRSSRDVAVLESPSWWTRGRILGFTGMLAFGTLLFVAWVAALRRRVNEQTAQIREQLKRESWLEAELQRAGKLESLGLLAGGIAHDFNNLLTVMMGNLSLAGLDEHLSAESVQSLRTAEKAAVRARDLTQQLLTFAKGGAPIRAAVSLPEVVREVAEFALRGAKTRCEFEIPAELWPANVDKGQIGQVVQNIVINAMQAMAVGGLIKISLRNESVGAELQQMMEPGRYVHLAIADHGPGIPPDDLQRIFDPYFTTKKQGNGLGLATVYSIVKKHLGHITAESVLGKGTTFNIWLPAAENDAGPEVAPVALASAPRGEREKQARVLILDDEESICQLGSSILRRGGARVTTVADGVQAVQAYQSAQQAGQPYDLVILDLTIPGGMGGRETLEKLLQLDPAVKAIVSSGYSNDLVLSDYQAHGFRGMISKPYEITDFANTVERVLRGDRA